MAQEAPRHESSSNNANQQPQRQSHLTKSTEDPQPISSSNASTDSTGTTTTTARPTPLVRAAAITDVRTAPAGRELRDGALGTMEVEVEAEAEADAETETETVVSGASTSTSRPAPRRRRTARQYYTPPSRHRSPVRDFHLSVETAPQDPDIFDPDTDYFSSIELEGVRNDFATSLARRLRFVDASSSRSISGI